MSTNKFLIKPYGRATAIIKTKDVPNGKLSVRFSSNYHDYIIVELSVRFCKGQDSHDLPDDLLGEVLYQSHINPVLLPDDSTI